MYMDHRRYLKVQGLSAGVYGRGGTRSQWKRLLTSDNLGLQSPLCHVKQCSLGPSVASTSHLPLEVGAESQLGCGMGKTGLELGLGVCGNWTQSQLGHLSIPGYGLALTLGLDPAHCHINELPGRQMPFPSHGGTT